MSRVRVTLLAAVLLLVAAASVAQSPMPKPGPEHQRLQYFVGGWTSTATMKPSPFGPGGEFKMSDACEWFEGQYFVVCKTQGSSPMGPVKSLALMGYDPGRKAYTYYAIDNVGHGSMAQGTVDGKTWTYSSEDIMEGKTVKSRFTLVETGANSYTFKWEIDQGGTWVAVMEGTATRTT